jgi:hypothetical protein
VVHLDVEDHQSIAMAKTPSLRLTIRSLSLTASGLLSLASVLVIPPTPIFAAGSLLMPWRRISMVNNMVDKEDTARLGKVRMYEELTSGEEVVDLSPPEALDRAEYFLVGQGYVVVQRTATTLTVEREGAKGAAGQESAPKVVVMAVPQPDGGVRIKVRGNDSEGLQGRQGLWKLWAENLPKRQH